MAWPAALSFEHEEILQKLISLASANQLVGKFLDLPEEVYNDPRCPGVRSGYLKQVIKTSVEHIENSVEQEDREEFRIGRAFHSLIAGEPLEKHGLDISELRIIKNMKSSLMRHPIWEIIQRCEKEVTFFAVDPQTGVLKRCRADLFDPIDETVLDLKTTINAAPSVFRTLSKRNGYGVSAAYYVEIISQVLGHWVNAFKIIAIEKSNPFGTKVYVYGRENMDRTFEDIRDGLRRIAQARNGGWKGYSLEEVDLFY